MSRVFTLPVAYFAHIIDFRSAPVYTEAYFLLSSTLCALVCRVCLYLEDCSTWDAHLASSVFPCVTVHT